MPSMHVRFGSEDSQNRFTSRMRLRCDFDLQDCTGAISVSDLISAGMDLSSLPTMTCSIFTISMPMRSDGDAAT